MLVALSGFMGSGKTTVGKLLAESLGCPFMDLDAIIEKEAGTTVSRLFDTEGEAGFRKRELDCLRRTLRRYRENTAILALGGGTPLSEEAAKLLLENSLCIYLKASADTILERLGPISPERPLWNPENAAQLLQQREALYKAAAHIVLETDGASPEEITDEIIIDCL
ncbi:MAG: shikimate kinase [Bacteroidales bacterium]|nr:shikimate kinase [Bacteroidales bacterium]